MESKNGFSNNTFQEKQDPSKDVLMEELSAVDPKVNSGEKSSTFTHHSYFRNTFSRNTFKLSTIKDVKARMQERAKNVGASRVITFSVILAIVGIFSIPIILYYALKADPIPELNSAFTDVNISMVNTNVYYGVIAVYIVLHNAVMYTCAQGSQERGQYIKHQPQILFCLRPPSSYLLAALDVLFAVDVQRQLYFFIIDLPLMSDHTQK